MKYIAHRRFNGEAICGHIDIPRGTPCIEMNGKIYRGRKLICVATSENAHNYFARNDDGNGLIRGRLTQIIVQMWGELSRKSFCLDILRDKRTPEQEEELKRINETLQTIWSDRRCQKYKRIEHADHWLWNHNFYNADVEDLYYIARLIGAEEKNVKNSNK